MADLADAIKPSPAFTVYAAAALPIVCADADPITAANGGGRYCRAVRMNGTGTVTVKRACDNTSVVLPFTDGETQMVQCREITSTTATSVTVLW